MDKDLEEYYNSDPVIYCPCCLSMHIVSGILGDYCRGCGNTELDEASIFEWLEKKDLAGHTDQIRENVYRRYKYGKPIYEVFQRLGDQLQGIRREG